MQNIRNTFIVILSNYTMVEIRIKSQINAPAEKVWDIVSNTDNEDHEIKHVCIGKPRM